MRRAATQPFGPRTGIIWQRFALWALIVAVAGLGLASPAAAQSAGPEKASKRDRFLEQHAANAPDDATFKVIITLRPGARKSLLQKLRAHGVEISHDHTIINAVAAELTARLIRRLEDDKDVVVISYDSEVSPSGIWSSVTGAAASSAYSLQVRSGLRRRPRPR